MINKVVDTFIDLVKIDSISGEEATIAKYISEKLKDLGINPVYDSTGNIFGKVVGQGESRLISAHMDTVEPGRGVKPRIKDGWITSDGTTVLGADNKAALAAILTALEITQNRKNIEIVFTVREETDGGIKEFDFSCLMSKRGLIADRANKLGTIVLSSPSIIDVNIQVLGKASHAAKPEQGKNALESFLNSMQKLKLGRIDNCTTFNIGKIHGGEATNTVPALIILEGEIRSFKQSSALSVVQKLKAAFSTNSKIRLNPYCTGYTYAKNEAYIEELVGSMHELEIKVEYEDSFGGSDANTFIQNGIKVINIGYGAIDTHTVNERIKVSDLEKLTDIYCRYIKS